MRKPDSTEYRGKTDIEFVEDYIERLNHQIERLPTEHCIRFLPCEHCGQLFMEINFEGEIPISEHERECKPDIFEVIEWGAEDEDYARQCVDEKWRSQYR